MTHSVILGAVFAAIVSAVLLGLYYSRRTTLEGRVGAFACRLYRAQDAAHASAGVGQYGVSALVWYRRHSLSARPARVWPRRELVITNHRVVDGQAVVTLACTGTTFTVVMSPAAYAGLAGWLEAGPRVLFPLQS